MGGGSEGERGFDFTLVSGDLAVEPVEEERLRIHGVGDDHAAYGDEDGDFDRGDAGECHEAEDGTGACCDAGESEGEGTGEVAGSLTYDAGGGKDHGGEDGDAGPAGTVEQPGEDEADDDNLKQAAKLGPGDFPEQAGRLPAGEDHDDESGQTGDEALE